MKVESKPHTARQSYVLPRTQGVSVESAYGWGAGRLLVGGVLAKSDAQGCQKMAFRFRTPHAGSSMRRSGPRIRAGRRHSRAVRGDDTSLPLLILITAPGYTRDLSTDKGQTEEKQKVGKLELRIPHVFPDRAKPGGSRSALVR